MAKTWTKASMEAIIERTICKNTAHPGITHSQITEAIELFCACHGTMVDQSNPGNCLQNRKNGGQVAWVVRSIMYLHARTYSVHVQYKHAFENACPLLGWFVSLLHLTCMSLSPLPSLSKFQFPRRKMSMPRPPNPPRNYFLISRSI